MTKDTRLRAAEDYDLYLRITRQFPVVRHAALVSEYRRHGSQMSGNLPLMLATTLRVLRAQRPWVAGDLQRHAAWRRGLSGWRNCYGRPLIWRIEQHVEHHDWRKAAGSSATLLRHAPGIVVRGALRALLRRAGVAGAVPGPGAPA